MSLRKTIVIASILASTFTPKANAVYDQNKGLELTKDCMVFLNQKDKDTLKNYIHCRATEKGVDPKLAVWIAAHESSFVEDQIGDKKYRCPKTGKISPSYGLYQISSCYHSEIKKEQAMNAEFATDWALEKMRERPEEWSSFRFRKVWYKDSI